MRYRCYHYFITILLAYIIYEGHWFICKVIENIQMHNEIKRVRNKPKDVRWLTELYFLDKKRLFKRRLLNNNNVSLWYSFTFEKKQLFKVFKISI